MGLDARQFLAKLQGDIASGSIEIAGFPDSCVRLLVELKDDFVSTQTLERIVRGDVALSGRVISMANSAAFQSSTGPTTTISGAIARIGLAAVEHLLQTWHVKLTGAMLKNWEFPEAVVRAATTYETAKDPSSKDPVADLLYVAGIFVDSKGDTARVASRLPLVAPAMRLGLATVNPEEILSSAAQEAASFGGALA